MCARFRSVRQLSQLPGFFQVGGAINFEFNPNLAPSESTPIYLTNLDGTRSVRLASFGIALAGRPAHARMVNSRTDKLRAGSFKKLLASNRCIIPAEGFYEWREENGKKQPYYFYRLDAQPILFAGLWDYSEIKGDKVASFAILTDEPNAVIAQFHDRMPVILDDPLAWLEPSDSPLDNIRPLGIDHFGVRPVNPAVNRVSEKSLEKIEAPIAGISQGVLF